jgi:hypothetical protein
MASVTTDDSVATTPDAADVAELILAYDRALALARTRSRLVAVRTRVPRDGRADRLWQVRWLRWPVEHFIAWHVTRTLNALHRALSRRVATGQADERDIADRETVAAYRDSMRPVHVKSYLAIVIVLTLLIGGFILKAAGPVLSDLPVLRFAEEYDAGFAEGAEAERRDVIEISDRTSNLFASFGDAISADVSSLGDTVEAFVGAEPSDSALVLAGFLFSLYLVTRILVPAYRLKRMLFNLADDPRGLSYSTARWNVKHATGVYRRERAVFASVDERLPREPPLDLLIPALWLSLPVALAVYLFRNTHDWIFSQPAGFWLLGIPFEFSVALATGLVTLSAVRIVWLGLTWRARRRSSTSLTPFEVRLPDGRHATVRNPAGVAVLVYLVPYYLPFWWGIVNRQLWLAGDRRRWAYPSLSFLAFLRLPRALVLPAVISLVLSRWRLHTVQRASGIVPRTAWATAKKLFWPVVLGYIVVLAPIPNISVLVAPLPTTLPIIDDTPNNSLVLSAVGLITSTSVLAFVAAYAQGRLNEVLALRGERIMEGPE